MFNLESDTLLQGKYRTEEDYELYFVLKCYTFVNMSDTYKKALRIDLLDE